MTDAEPCAGYAKLADVTGMPLHLQATEDLDGIISNREMVMREAINLALWQKHVREWLWSRHSIVVGPDPRVIADDGDKSYEECDYAALRISPALGEFVARGQTLDAANFAAVRAVAKETT